MNYLVVNDAVERSLSGAGQSQSERLRALEDILAYLLNEIANAKTQGQLNARQIEENGQRISQAVRLMKAVRGEPEAAAEPGGPRHAARRDRPRLRVIPGGLAAFTPVAFLAGHGMGAVTFAGVRLWLKSAWGRWIASVLLFGVAGAVAAPVVGMPDLARAGVPHPHAIVAAHRHHRRARWQIPAVPPVAPLPARHASRHHYHARDDDAQAAPSPSPADTGSPTPTDSPTPAPSASATGTGFPTPEPSG